VKKSGIIYTAFASFKLMNRYNPEL